MAQAVKLMVLQVVTLQGYNLTKPCTGGNCDLNQGLKFNRLVHKAHDLSGCFLLGKNLNFRRYNLRHRQMLRIREADIFFINSAFRSLPRYEQYA